MRYCIAFVFVLLYVCSILLSQATAYAHQLAQVTRGNVAGHVWLDADCDGIKDTGEGNVANLGIVQLVNTGRDRILNPGDGAITAYTDVHGNWLATNQPVNDFLDGQPWLYAVAVGEGTAAGLGYKVSPESGDSILSGPTHASATFQVEAGVTKQMGEIGLCPLSAGQNIKIYLPMLQH